MSDRKIRVLFVCVHNSARSQMAETFLTLSGGDAFDVESAGLEAGELNPAVVQVLDEVGIDISGNTTKSVFDLFKQGKHFHYVITVCDETFGERCPVFPGLTKRLHWNFDDPDSFKGTAEEILEQTRDLRDRIKKQIELFQAEVPSLEQHSILEDQ